MSKMLLVEEKELQQALEAMQRAQFELRGVTPTQDIQESVAAIAKRLAQPEQEPEYCHPGTELYKVAAMVMSDCGHSSNNQRLLDRVAQRIEKHLDAHAVLVAAAEREACAKVCEDAAIRLLSGKARVNQVDRHTAAVLQEKAAAIRARGKTWMTI